MLRAVAVGGADFDRHFGGVPDVLAASTFGHLKLCRVRIQITRKPALRRVTTCTSGVAPWPLLQATPDTYRRLARAKILDTETRALPALAEGRLYARDERRLVAVALR